MFLTGNGGADEEGYGRAARSRTGAGSGVWEVAELCLSVAVHAIKPGIARHFGSNRRIGAVATVLDGRI